MATKTITGHPWPHPHPGRSRLRLVQVPAAVLRALARDDADGEVPDGVPRGAGDGGAGLPAAVSTYLAGPDCAWLWRIRSRQVSSAPGDAPWVTRFVETPDAATFVGLAGFHGPPDDRGMVEIGYRIDPGYRRRGYARQSLETLLGVARAHPDVHVVRATISPDNAASRALVAQYGFQEVGEQWDEEDGLEIIFEVAAGSA